MAPTFRTDALAQSISRRRAKLQNKCMNSLSRFHGDGLCRLLVRARGGKTPLSVSYKYAQSVVRATESTRNTPSEPATRLNRTLDLLLPNNPQRD